MGVCPHLEFDNIMFINYLGYDFYIYGAFEFFCKSIATGLYPIKWNTVFGNSIKSKMGNLNLIRKNIF